MSDLFLARAIHFDESDRNVFHAPARTGEWCVSGGFEFSNWSEGDLTGKARQAFANGWMGVETFGRVTFVGNCTGDPMRLLPNAFRALFDWYLMINSKLVDLPDLLSFRLPLSPSGLSVPSPPPAP